MKSHILIISLVLCLISIIIIPVTAEYNMSCSFCEFINISKGDPGPMNQTPNMTAGTNGYSGNISVNATFTLASGNPANVLNIGNGTYALFNFYIPQGPQGDPGSPGSPGTPGLNNMTMNLTPNMTMNLTPNMTANMTAGIDGINNMTMNLTPNMTAGSPGAPGLDNMTMNLTPNMTAGINGLNNMTMNLTPNMTANTTVYGYVSLMVGSSMIPTTNPAVVDQAETSGQKNNYIYGNFTDGGSENLQWIVDMPADWNESDATTGKVSFYPLWTAGSGSGTVKWDIAGKCFPDDAALDTALAAIGSSTDTLLTTGDMHVGPASTAAVITSTGTGGNTCILKVTRDSSGDTLNGVAQLLGIRIRYIRTFSA